MQAIPDQPHFFDGQKRILGMVHVGALPGTPFAESGMELILERALSDAGILMDSGCDGFVVENMHDRPYLKRAVGPEVVAAMTRVVSMLRAAFPTALIGVQVLAGANREALAVAHVGGADFIRAECSVFGHLADEGWMDADAGELLRYRKMIGANEVRIFTDLRKKHSSHAMSADLDLREWAKAADFCAMDGMIVTGGHTGEAPLVDHLQAARDGSEMPLLVGSGAAVENVAELLALSNGVIVGSSIKVDGDWRNPVCGERTRRLVDAARV